MDKITVDESNSISIGMRKLAVPSAGYAKDQSLRSLRTQVDADKLQGFIEYINNQIETSTQEGNFSCIISNDALEDFCSTEEEAFDDALIQYVVQYLRSIGYKVKYEELIYSDISNLIEITW